MYVHLPVPYYRIASIVVQNSQGNLLIIHRSTSMSSVTKSYKFGVIVKPNYGKKHWLLFLSFFWDFFLTVRCSFEITQIFRKSINK